MKAAFSDEAFQQRIFESELGNKWKKDPLLLEDTWSFIDLGYSQEECQIRGFHKLYFEDFSLPWLKLLTKLTVRARSRERHSIEWLHRQVRSLHQLETFMTSLGYFQPEDLSNELLQQFLVGPNHCNHQYALAYAIKLWKEEGWLSVQFIPPKRQRKSPEIKIIPEEVLHQIYEKFDLLPPMLGRMFRLQLALGCRITEILKLPHSCLKWEQNQCFLLRWIQKHKKWHFQGVHPLIAELVQEQQKFIAAQFGIDTDFDYLFCSLSAGGQDGARGKRHEFKRGLTRFQVEKYIYRPTVFPKGQVGRWLKSFSEAADLKDKYGNRFYLSSHMFRRTKASIMAYCEIEDEYIAAVLGHTSLDMLPHYRQRSLERLEKDAQAKGYVDMYGNVTTFKPRKRRYESLKDLLKTSTQLGECHRPDLLGDCQYRYSCLNCSYHRITLEDRPKLENDLARLKQDLFEAEEAGKQRRVTEINRLLELINNRIRGLNELLTLLEE
jgi:integrase